MLTRPGGGGGGGRRRTRAATGRRKRIPAGPVSQVAARRGEDVDTTRRGRRRRREEEEEGRDAAAEESGSAASSKRQRGDLADRISALPEELRTCILRFLPLTTAMRASALSAPWRHIWKSRWELLDGQPSSLSYHLLPGVYPSPDELLSLLMKAQHRGLNSFSLIVETSDMTPDIFNSILSRAADFHAEDLRIEIRPCGLDPILFHFEAYTAHLCRLSLTNIRISGLHLESGDSVTSLVCLQLCHVGISDTILASIVALSPSLLVLHVLEIEYLQEIALGTASSKLRTLTITGCKWVTRVDVGALNTLQCFRYSGPYSSLCFSAHTLINDIYVRFEGSSDHSFKWLEAMPDFSNLTVMTICDIALPVLSSVSGLHLQKVSEMQLILRTLDSTITGQIHELLSMCACQLQKLFMQLPTGSDYLGELEGDERLEGAPQLEKLVLIKVLNFDGDGAQMVLLRSLLLKAPGLAKLLLIGRRRGELQEHQVLDDLTTAQIVLRKDDDTDTELVHSRESVLVLQ